KDVLSIVLLLTNVSGMGLLRAAQQPEHPLSQDDIESFLMTAQQQKTSPGKLLFSGEIPLMPSIEGYRSLERLSAIIQILLLAPNLWSLLAQYLLIETTAVRGRLNELGQPATRQDGV